MNLKDKINNTINFKLLIQILQKEEYMKVMENNGWEIKIYVIVCFILVAVIVFAGGFGTRMNRNDKAK